MLSAVFPTTSLPRAILLHDLLQRCQHVHIFKLIHILLHFQRLPDTAPCFLFFFFLLRLCRSLRPVCFKLGAN